MISNRSTLLFILFLGSWIRVTPQFVTWCDHVAPIIYENCSSCHHEGGIGPFNLMSYQDAVNYGSAIHESTEEKEMPPWPADPAYRHFVDEAVLTESEIDAIHLWIEGGMLYGNQLNEPVPPVFSLDGSLLDTIDFVVAIEPYTLQLNTDEYRWFVIENPFTEPVYISKLEVFAGLKNIVHHADLFLDNTGNSLSLDMTDPLSGFNGSTGTPTNTYYINAWQPGGNIAKYPSNWGIEVLPGDDFVIEVHFGPGGIGLTDSTRMNLQFVKEPQNVRPVNVGWLLYDSAPCLVDGPLVIPANEVVTFHQQSAPLSFDMSLISICPHMHLLGKSYRVWFEAPDGSTVPLIDIPQWDFHWQKYYTFEQILKIPAGSILRSEGVYDNTVNNPENPNNPPQTVTKGWTTEDEMFLCYFIFAQYEQGDESIEMTEPVGIVQEEINSSFFTLFPNPVEDYLKVWSPKNSSSPVKLQIMDLLGRIVEPLTEFCLEDDGSTIIPLAHLPKGKYFLEMQLPSTKEVKPFIKK